MPIPAIAALLGKVAAGGAGAGAAKAAGAGAAGAAGAGAEGGGGKGKGGGNPEMVQQMMEPFSPMAGIQAAPMANPPPTQSVMLEEEDVFGRKKGTMP